MKQPQKAKYFQNTFIMDVEIFFFFLFFKSYCFWEKPNSYLLIYGKNLTTD